MEKKQALYRSIVERLHASTGAREEDVMIVLTEAGTEDWSFGLGDSQYVLNPPKGGTPGDWGDDRTRSLRLIWKRISWMLLLLNESQPVPR